MKYLVAGAIVVALGVIQPAPTLAAPSCDGHPATIVGTAGADEIAGTQSDDVIVARGGDDHVSGGHGRDLVCGGKGNDRLGGGHGPDRLLGNGGEDVLSGGDGDDHLEGGYARDYLHGGAQDDRLAGGPGDDACLQLGGSGRMTGCENLYADLAIVAVDCPDAATLDVPFECQVTVTNHGPEAAHYVLVSGDYLPSRTCGGSCGLSQAAARTIHTVHHPDAGTLLAAGAERTDAIGVTITRWPSEFGVQGKVWIQVRPTDVFDAIDLETSNDHGSTPIERA